MTPRVRTPLRRVGALLLVLAAAVARPAPAAADGATYANLLDRAQKLLQEAERAGRKNDAAATADLARQAMALLETADRLQPSDRDAPFLGVQAGVFAKDPAATRLWLERFQQRNVGGERNPELHWLRAMVYLKLDNRPDLALRSLDRMLALNPAVLASQRDILYYAALDAEGARKAAAEEYDAAIQLFRAAAMLGRQRGDRNRELAAWGNVGLVMQADDRFAEAEEVFQDLARRDPENPYWHYRLGVNRANQNLWEQAIPFYEEVVRLLDAGRVAPTRQDELHLTYLRLGNSFRNVAAKPETSPADRARLFERARALLATFMERAPKDARGPYWMGTLFHVDMERPYEAIPYYRKAFELDPVCDHSLRNLIQIYTVYGPPPPAGGGEPSAEALAAWEAERARMMEDLDANRDAREDERDRRESGPNKDDGCE